MERELMKTTITVRAVVFGNPSALIFAKRLHGINGGEKMHTEAVSVSDEALFRRLQEEVRPGDEIEASLATDWYPDSFSTSLNDFRLLKIVSAKVV
ncbi:MAG: hypothetical protein ACR2PL_14905 [Dehalococcoidia bacterium]